VTERNAFVGERPVSFILARDWLHERRKPLLFLLVASSSVHMAFTLTGCRMVEADAVWEWHIVTQFNHALGWFSVSLCVTLPQDITLVCYL